jgi:CheY-like chemotaxis protein
MPHVLVVDDQPDICAIIEIALTDLGRYRVSSAHTGEDALVLLDRDRPDLVLLDAVMPGMSPMELALHTTQRGIPIVMMTGNAQMGERLDALGWRYLQKPFRLELLLAECAEVMAQLQANVIQASTSLARMMSNRDELARVVERSRLRRDRGPK